MPHRRFPFELDAMNICRDAGVVLFQAIVFAAMSVACMAEVAMAIEGVPGGKRIATGSLYTCAITEIGEVRCWGAGQNGELGDGSSLNRGTPTTVRGINEPVVAIAGGSYHVCVVTLSGSVKCWGLNTQGQLGNNSQTASATPVDAVGLGSGIVSITAGRSHTCALSATSELYCWGANSFGQLGDQTTIQRLVPVHVLSNLSSVSAGGEHTCATTLLGQAECWGRGNRGQLGNADFTQSSYPVAVTGLLGGVYAITAGNQHSCAVTAGGEVKCWGANDYAQLGDSTTIDRLTPVDVTSMTSGTTIVNAGNYHTCAIQLGAVKCWGRNNTGRLGNGSRIDSAIPVAVTGLPSAAQQIDAGGAQSCALVSAGSFWCWGSNEFGQIGIGSMGIVRTAVEVAQLQNAVTEIGVGNGHACAIRAGEVVCWGSNRFGQLGDGTHDDHLVPAATIGFSGAAVSLSVGGDNTCALASGGVARCWGSNAMGQLGDGTQLERTEPTNVVGLGNGIRQIATASTHSCALTAVGGVKCWGSNQVGELGDNSYIDHFVAADVNGLTSGVDAVSVGPYHSCALLASGGVKCWGSVDIGAGTGIYVEPVDMPGFGSNVTAIASGYGFDCASINGTAFKCRGGNDYGNLGNGTTESSQTDPVDVLGFEGGATSISAGDWHACAINGAGVARCWGMNELGELGDGTQQPFRSTPVDVVGLDPGVAVISAGSYGSCALSTSGQARCWGENIFGQVGNGETGSILKPASVLIDEELFRAGFE
jgi:alpha-tubulin suppressor-like RCC1 family protein